MSKNVEIDYTLNEKIRFSALPAGDFYIDGRGELCVKIDTDTDDNYLVIGRDYTAEELETNLVTPVKVKIKVLQLNVED